MRETARKAGVGLATLLLLALTTGLPLWIVMVSMGEVVEP